MPRIALVKTAYPTQYGAPGEEITYTYTVTNTGYVTLHNVTVADDRIHGPVTCEATTLAPGQSTTCRAIYTTTADDVESGSVTNTAVATGHPEVGPPVTAEDSDTVDAIHVPGIQVQKTAFPSEFSVPGEQITYTYEVVNTGNVTLHGITVTDSRLGPVTCPYTTLAPAAAMTCRAVHTTTAADVDAGHVPNAVAVAGDPPTGPPVTDTDTETILAIHVPGIQIQKTAAPAMFGAVGQPITFTYQVVNTGNVTLRRIVVTDSKVGRVSCPSTTLAPGAAMVCQATYLTTAADVAAGQATNVTAVTGYPPTGPAVSASDEAIIVALPEVPVTG